MNTKLDDAIGRVLCEHYMPTHTYIIPMNSTHKIKNYTDIINKINEYLCVGGDINPEMMGHEKVRDLLIEIRDLLQFFQTKDEANRRTLQAVLAKYQH